MTSSKTVPCGKCDATGTLRAFMHIDNGRCFACAGSGRVEHVEGTAGRAPRKLTRWEAIQSCKERVRGAQSAAEFRDALGEWTHDELEGYGVRFHDFVAYVRESGHVEVAERCERAVCAALGRSLDDMRTAAGTDDARRAAALAAWKERHAAMLAEKATKHKKRRTSVTPA